MGKLLDSLRPVVENSKHVSIDQKKIDEFCRDFKYKEIRHWLELSPFNISRLDEDDRLNFLLILDSINFCYWGDPKWTVEYKGEKYDGTWAMITSLIRALNEGKPILDFKYLSKMDKEELGSILHGNIQIPLFKERLNILREVGKAMTERYDGKFSNLIDLADNDIFRLLDLIIASFPSFNDYSIYNGKKVYFLKRAQLLALDIHNLSGRYENINIGELVGCAEYKIPQSLRKLGIISYSNNLSNKVDNRIEIPKNSQEEIEIRANTLWAIKLITDQLNENSAKITRMDINDHLWLLGQTKSPDDKSYHLTRTTAY